MRFCLGNDMNRILRLDRHGPQWTPRLRLYAVAFGIAGAYLVALSEFGNRPWAQWTVPGSSALLLLLCLAGAEACLFIQRLQHQHEELRATREREIETSQRLAVQRQTLLNQICRALIDKLDVTQLPPSVLEDIAHLFAADAVATWVLDPSGSGHFTVRGVHGLQAHRPADVAAVPWSFPHCEGVGADAGQKIVTDFASETSPAMATFCQREKIHVAVFSPVLRGDELAGIVGVFYRETRNISPSLAAEMQTVANIIASAIQAEELYRNLVQVQKIESVGTLASGIAHDMNNVLAAILACATYVKQHSDPADPTYRYLEATEASAHRGAALTKQLLSFVRREGPRLAVINANDCIEQTLKMLERSLDKSILINRHLAPDLKPIEVDPSQLEQVILNMAINARDAMPDGGFFTVSSRNITLDKDNPYRPNIDLPDGDYTVLGFRDTGCGMDEATQKRIFEPFFTTKRSGNGTGLGLSLILSIVRNAGGEIRLESKPNIGTLFEVYLPVTQKPLPAKAAQAASETRGGRECILLAEDEEIIREMAQLGLESKGYRVITAADGAAALARYRDQWEHIDLVVADMAMPRMSGSELFARIKEINPNVRVIVSSGYSHDQEGQRMLRHGCLGFLQKPYNVDQLCHHVRSVLDSGL
jgi:signal transduction histidine kinase/CheY-like chemotaxis protein